MGWYSVADIVEVLIDLACGAIVASFATRKEQELVEELKGAARRLVNGCNNNELYENMFVR